jgi:SAM-dependent methyltransferase
MPPSAGPKVRPEISERPAPGRCHDGQMTIDGLSTGAEYYGETWADIYDEHHAFLVPTEAQLSLLAELAGGGQALELGIGTGRVALPLAARGVKVEGIDASVSMVARMRSKPGGEVLPVVLGDMADVAPAGRFRLVYVVFNTFFALLSQEDQVRCFKAVAAALEPDGAFLLECFVPDPTRYDRGQSLRTMHLGDEDVRIDASRHDSVGQLVRSNVVHITNSSVSVRPVHLRYAWPAELDLMSQLAGLRLDHRWGGWGKEPFSAVSTSHVSVYRR